MSSELRKGLGKLWKEKLTPINYEDYYNEFKEEIDKELGLVEKNLTEKKSKKVSK